MENHICQDHMEHWQEELPNWDNEMIVKSGYCCTICGEGVEPSEEFLRIQGIKQILQNAEQDVERAERAFRQAKKKLEDLKAGLKDWMGE